MLVWFLPLFLIFLLIGLPVFFGLLAAPGILLWLNDQARDGAPSLAWSFNQSKIPGAANNPKNTGKPINKNIKNKGRNQTNIIVSPIFVYRSLQVSLIL